MYRTFALAICFLALASLGYPAGITINTNGYIKNYVRELEFNQETRVTGVKAARVRFYDLEERFGQATEVPYEESLCEYDNNGNIMKYRDYRITTKYISEKNKWQMQDEPIIQQIEYEYDGSERLTTKKELGKLSRYLYDEKGHLLMIKTYNDDLGNDRRGKVDRTVSYFYDGKGNCIKEDSETPFSGHLVTEYGYDSSDRKITQNLQGELVRRTYFSYNETGKISKISQCSLGISGKTPVIEPMLTDYYIYNPQGYLVSDITRWAQEENTESPITGIRVDYLYDRNGNLIRGDFIGMKKDGDSESETKIGYFEIEYDPSDLHLLIEEPRFEAISIGMSDEDLVKAGYNQELRIGLKKDGNDEWPTYRTRGINDAHDRITFYLENGKVKGWKEEKSGQQEKITGEFIPYR